MEGVKNKGNGGGEANGGGGDKAKPRNPEPDGCISIEDTTDNTCPEEDRRTPAKTQQSIEEQE